MENSSFWEQKDAARKKVEELKNTKNIVEIFQRLDKELEDLSVLAGLSGDEEDSNEELMFELDKLTGELDELELKAVLNNPNDINNAFLVIHPGAGGTESCLEAGGRRRLPEAEDRVVAGDTYVEGRGSWRPCGWLIELRV